MNIWSSVLQSIKKKVSSQAYNDWLKPTYEISHDDRTVRVKVPNERFREHLQEQYGSLIHTVLEESGQAQLKIDFIVEGPTQLTLAQMEDTVVGTETRTP